MYSYGGEEVFTKLNPRTSLPETEDGLVWDMLGQLGLLAQRPIGHAQQLVRPEAAQVGCLCDQRIPQDFLLLGGGAEAVPAVHAVAHAGPVPAVDEDAVHPVADLELRLEGFEVNVARAGLGGPGDQQVDEAHDRRLGGHVAQVLGIPELDDRLETPAGTLTVTKDSEGLLELDFPTCPPGPVASAAFNTRFSST